MSYTALPLPDLWRRLAQYEAFSAFSLVRDTVDGLSCHSFTDSFSAAVEKAAEADWISPATAQLLAEFARGCGSTDLQGQQAHVEYYRTLLSAEEEESRRLWQERGRVYRVLGLTGGVALALLLM